MYQTLAYKRGHVERAYMFYFLCLHTKGKKKTEPKEMHWLEVVGGNDEFSDYPLSHANHI